MDNLLASEALEILREMSDAVDDVTYNVGEIHMEVTENRLSFNGNLSDLDAVEVYDLRKYLRNLRESGAILMTYVQEIEDSLSDQTVSI